MDKRIAFILTAFFFSILLTSTGSAWYSDRPFEDFTTYTEVDPANNGTANITVVNSTWVDFGLEMSLASYLYRDYGVDAFTGDFSFNFTGAVYQQTGNPTTVIWGISNSTGAKTSWADGISVEFYQQNGYARIVAGAGAVGCNVNNPPQPAFFHVWRSSTNAGGNTNYTMDIYSDRNHTTLFGGCSITYGDGSDEYRYLYGLTSHVQNGRNSTGWVSHLYAPWSLNKSVTVNAPGQYQTLYTDGVTFNYTPKTNASHFGWCRLYSNETGWSLAVANSTSIQNGTANILEKTFSEYGTYLYSIECMDSDGDLLLSGNRSVNLIYSVFNISIYDEANGSLFNVSHTNNTILTVHCENRTLTYNMTATNTINASVNCAFNYLKLTMDFDGTEYFRRLIPTIQNGSVDFYMVDLTTDTKVDINIYLDDLTGRFAESILTLTKPVNNQTVIILRSRFDAERRVLAYLMTNEEYTPIVASLTETRVTSNILADASGDKTLSITDIPIIPNIITVYKNVSWAFIPDNTTSSIRFMYNDSEGATTNVSVWFYNGTNTSQLLYYASSSADNVIFTYSPVDINQSYLVIFNATHTVHGLLRASMVVSFARTIHGVEGVDPVYLMFAGLSICTMLAVIFGPKHSAFGGIVVSIAAAGFWFMGWFSGYIEGVIVMFVFIIALINFLTKKSGGGG